MHGLQTKGIIRKNKIIFSAVKLFMEKGYSGTSTTEISRLAGISQTSFFAAFENKEALLLELTKYLFSNQFEIAEGLTSGKASPLFLYCFECSIQMAICELSEPVSEVYVMAYSLPSTSEYIYSSMAKRLSYFFADYMPDAAEKDYYECDIASSGITRGFMAKKCDRNFTFQDKLSRYLDLCMKIYNVPIEIRTQIISEIAKTDFTPIAKKIIDEILSKAEKGLNT